MDSSYERHYHDLERKHWWFQGRRHMLSKLLKNTPKTSAILELGCSTGALLEQLHQQGFMNLTGVDISKQAITACKRQGLTNTFVMDATSPKLPANTYDLIIASDLLEHLAEDAKAIASWHRLLKPGGRIILFVPAFPFLYGHHDKVNHHQRRYTKKTLRTVICSSPLTTLRLAYWNFLLFFPLVPLRLFAKYFSRSTSTTGDLSLPPKLINTVLTTLLRLENTILTFFPFPVGLSLFAVLQKQP